MASLVLTIRETLRYRGAVGQWSWVLHRVTGLGVVLFLILHVIDTSWAVFYPSMYEHAIKIYQSPLFTLGEFALVFCVVYHAFNGLRIGIMDNRPELWRYQDRAAYIVLGATVLVLVPVFIGMGLHVVDHYQEPVNNLPLTEVLISQLPFAAGMGAAIIGALILSAIYGVLMGSEKATVSAKHSGSPIERFWWNFMRISGLLIIPLVFGHLAMMHIIQGVFDITAAGYPVVGVPQVGQALTDGSVVIGNGWNDAGSAVEFVAERWTYAIAGVAIWRVYDIALLILVTLHGFNGLRYVLTDYTMDKPLLRRASVIVCFIGALVLLGVGGGALLGSIEPTAIEQAKHAMRAVSMAGQ
ncbi:MAG: succinate dehydrogenase, cytochrome b556 subunit [Anaerolineae bacterium]|jgi:succinate dehydrogenase / fumarate reductase cytochrome b subunit|nr:succinate dehydrogenase, cytochrome b556 subunit [Anaerolineae bacterium]